MYLFKFLGILAIIPTTMLLTVSFFVLFAIRKLDSRNLKAFGYGIVVLLWVSAAIVFSMGIYKMTTKSCPIMHEMQKIMRTPMQRPMMEGQTQGPMMKH